MDDRGRVIALDPNRERLTALEETARRLGASIIEPRAGRVEEHAEALAGFADAVLVDAPCSNLGVLRRHPEAKWQRTAADIAKAAVRQRSILSAAAAMLRPGGHLVYATCSLEPEENEAVVEQVLGDRPDLDVDPSPASPLPADARGFVRALPHRHGTDGFTAVRLGRAR